MLRCEISECSVTQSQQSKSIHARPHSSLHKKQFSVNFSRQWQVFDHLDGVLKRGD